MSVCVPVYTNVLSLPGRVKLWADTFGRDLYNTVTKYSGSLLLQKVSNPLPGSSQGDGQPLVEEKQSLKSPVLQGVLEII